MHMQPSRPTMFSPYPRRRAIWAALLCAFGAALAVAVFVGSALAANNLLANSSFEKDSDGDGLPNNWIDFGTGIAPKRVCNQSVAGSCSLKVVLDANDKGVMKILSFNLIDGDSGIV